MKTSSFLRLALLSAAALFTHAAFAAKPGPNPPAPPSSGMLVLDYLYPESYAKNWGLTVAPSGTIYASGIADHRGLVLASTDSGNTWIGPLDDFAPSGRDVFAWYLGGGIASDAAGNLYVAGATYDFDEIQADQWYVRRSTDGGATWTTVDDFISGTPGYYGSRDVTGVAVDAAGDVYISGLSEVSGSQASWTIRKGVGGASFSTVDVVVAGFPYAIFAHPTAGILVVGTKGGAWVVRRSADGGATWSDVDTFQLSKGNLSPAAALGIGADARGNLFVAGRGRASNRQHWLVRKSIDGGGSWSTVDDFLPSGIAEARRFAGTSNGDLYVAGVANDSTKHRWIVRKNPGGSGTWTTIDDYQYVPATSTEPHAMAADASGNLFVGGGGGAHWLIKRY